MPNPKKRHSRCKRGQRRSHDALVKPAVAVCEQCGEPRRPHHICLKCGFYGGKSVIKKEESA